MSSTAGGALVALMSSLALALGSRRVGGALPPPTAVRVLALAAAVAAQSTVTGLLLRALPVFDGPVAPVGRPVRATGTAATAAGAIAALLLLLLLVL
jgi:hypothetical protein